MRSGPCIERICSAALWALMPAAVMKGDGCYAPGPFPQRLRPRLVLATPMTATFPETVVYYLAVLSPTELEDPLTTINSESA